MISRQTDGGRPPPLLPKQPELRYHIAHLLVTEHLSPRVHRATASPMTSLAVLLIDHLPAPTSADGPCACDGAGEHGVGREGLLIFDPPREPPRIASPAKVATAPEQCNEVPVLTRVRRNDDVPIRVH